MVLENEHQKFFSELLDRTANAYENSEIKSKKLYYSVCATPLYQNSTLILGFNWGAGKNKINKAQTEMDTNTFTNLDLGSLKRTLNFFTQYLPDENQDAFVQSNYCFFRSKKEKDISHHDLALTKELFDSLVEYLHPNKVISFSSKLKKYFENKSKLTSINSITIKSGRINFCAAKAILSSKGDTIPILFLPHPNYPITSEARHAAWKHCFSKL